MFEIIAVISCENIADFEEENLSELALQSMLDSGFNVHFMSVSKNTSSGLELLTEHVSISLDDMMDEGEEV
jgi:hypothetical protein